MNKHLLITSFFLHLFSLFIFSCKQNAFISEKLSNKHIVGYKKSNLIIGKTYQKNALNYKEYERNGLFLDFDRNNKLRTVFVRGANYCLNGKVCVGDDIDMVKKNFGQPVVDSLNYYSGNGTLIATYECLVYDKYIVFPDTLNKIKEITFGNYFSYEKAKK